MQKIITIHRILFYSFRDNNFYGLVVKGFFLEMLLPINSKNTVSHILKELKIFFYTIF